MRLAALYEAVYPAQHWVG
ncbi:hypothetical protein GMOD_00009197 [Pyrenophora seminiperda CCB06]|uniref:Uncharacterized protein n=1 Tax=Pyrenophora seminiperda CCB06 TaxID=1302712 RepID=A0A3M7MBG0_9PLEO|nr:hypothetical protein GMOD_00009197 [Pyrenophora seminiperda CCB06]